MAKLLIDDTRTLTPTAKRDGWVLLRQAEELPRWIEEHGWPDAVDLDYDLELGGGTWDGAQAARWLREAFSETGRPPEEFPLWDVHSRVESNNQYVAEILADFGMRRQVGLAPIHTDR